VQNLVGSVEPERRGIAGVELEDQEDKELQDDIESMIIKEKPDVKWEDVANLDEAKQALRESVILPMLRPDLFTGARRPWKGVLLFGPPGCGKTLIAKAVANEAGCTFFNADAASIVSKWLGESERLVKNLFGSARKEQPAIVFMDEVDALTGERGSDQVGGERRLKTQFLIEMDGMKSRKGDHIVVLGATNRPWDLDAAFRRRFERRIMVPMPEFEARVRIFEIHTKGIDLAPLQRISHMDCSQGETLFLNSEFCFLNPGCFRGPGVSDSHERRLWPKKRPV